MAGRGRPRKNFKDALPEGFAETADSAKTEELRSMVSRFALDMSKIEEERKNNEAIKSAKEAMKELVGPYSETISVLKKKIRYIAQILEERGAK